MLYLLFMTLLIAVVVTPIVIFTVARVVPRIVDRTVPPIVRGTSPEVEARLARIEEAIDAMAIEIERIRTGDLQAYDAPPRLGTVKRRSGDA